MERAARIRRSGREGARSATGYPGAPRHAIRESVGGECWTNLGFCGSRHSQDPGDIVVVVAVEHVCKV